MSMLKTLHYVKFGGKRDFHTGGVPTDDARGHTFAMRFRLAQYRKERKMTQQQVADALGISVGLYNQLESGKRRMNETYLGDLAALYSVSPVQLIVDDVRNDPLFDELDAAWRLLSPAERRILVSSAKGIAAGHEKT